MSVGEALNEARHQAGLSVEELSERTKIRGTVIRSIEQDDYEACGGDLYARGYVRAIAGAVGIDAQPLIREYDLRHVKGQPGVAPPETAQTSSDLPAAPEPPAKQAPVPPADLGATRYDIPVVAAGPAVTSYDLPRVPAEPPAAEPPASAFAVAGHPAAGVPDLVPPGPGPGLTPGPASAPLPAVAPGAAKTQYDLTALPEEPSREAPEDLMAAGYDLVPSEVPSGANAGTLILPAAGPGQPPPPAAAWPASAQGGAGRKSRRGLFIVAAAVVVIAVGALGFSLASKGAGAPTAAAVGAGPGASASAAARASQSAAQASASAAAAQASASAAARASASASARAAARRVVSLPVASVTAFGPDGAADGDDPGNAANAIADDPSRPWTTQWYATPKFGMLKHGTGLLLDLGGKVTVTSVRLAIAPYQGADLQIRVGNARALTDLHVAATANDAGGSLKLTLRHPVAARYLLIWFTRLAPNGAGKYQETVSQVAVAGRR